MPFAFCTREREWCEFAGGPAQQAGGMGWAASSLHRRGEQEEQRKAHEITAPVGTTCPATGARLGQASAMHQPAPTPRQLQPGQTGPGTPPWTPAW